MIRTAILTISFKRLIRSLDHTTKKEEITALNEKKWIKPSFKKMSIKKITLSGSAGALEQNSGQGAGNKKS